MKDLPAPLASLLVALRPALLWGYRVLTRAVARYLRHDLSETSVYVAGTGASEELVVRLSDIDLVAVVGGAPETVAHDREILLARWRRARRFLGVAARILGISIYGEEDLADEVGATVLTYGLSRNRRLDGGGYLRPGRPSDELYRRLHPGIYGPGRTWRLVAGTRRTRDEPLESGDYRRIAAWLELQWWWRFAFELCTSPHRAFASYLAFKLAAEPARIWLWLAHRERVTGRRRVLERTLLLLPEEEGVLRRALRIQERLPRAAEPPRDETLAWLLRIGTRIAALLESEVAEHGVDAVRLVDGGVVLRPEARAALRAITPRSQRHPRLPLADWRSRAMPPTADETLVAVEVDPADHVAIGALAQLADVGFQPAVLADRLLVLPNDALSDRVLLRSVQCAISDPVSFAVLAGRSTAAFPCAPGFSALDCAQRAVGEHSAWLAAQNRAEAQPELALDLLFTAARAALFLESFEAGDPELALSAEAVASALGDRYPRARTAAEEAYSAFCDHRAAGVPARAPVVAALRGAVGDLVSYRGAA